MSEIALTVGITSEASPLVVTATTGPKGETGPKGPAADPADGPTTVTESGTTRTTSSTDEGTLLRLTNAAFTGLTLGEFSAVDRVIAVELTADISGATLTPATGMTITHSAKWDDAAQGDVFVFQCVVATPGSQEVVVL